MQLKHISISAYNLQHIQLIYHTNVYRYGFLINILNENLLRDDHDTIAILKW